MGFFQPNCLKKYVRHFFMLQRSPVIYFNLWRGSAYVKVRERTCFDLIGSGTKNIAGDVLKSR